MTQDFRPGDAIRHAKRGSRYLITDTFRAPFTNVRDEARMFLVQTWDDSRSDRGPVLLMADRLPSAAVAVDTMVPVMVQIDEETQKSACRGDWFLYESLDAPGQKFVRPAIEFGGGRFELCVAPGALRNLVAGLMPEEQFGILAEWERIRAGGQEEGTRLAALADDYVGMSGYPAGHGRHVLMSQIAETTDQWLGADMKRLPVSMDPEATRVVLELSANQDLSPAKVMLQALRLYQAHIHDVTPGPVMGCMGD